MRQQLANNRRLVAADAEREKSSLAQENGQSGNFLLSDGSKCIRSGAQILPSIRSLLIRLAPPSLPAGIRISGRADAGVTHAPRALRVPAATCQYAPDAADQCLLNHSPNRENDNYKKWRLCTLCKCCAMTLEPNGHSY